jgi:hypothetical protein
MMAVGSQPKNQHPQARAYLEVFLDIETSTLCFTGLSFSKYKQSLCNHR